MSDNPLSRKVELDLTNYKAGIAEMNRSIRVIESGFRANAAALGDWSKDASGLEQRIQALNGTIDLQRAKVDGLRSVYEQVATEQGVNSRAAQELEIKLNKETEQLNKMESELVTTEEALAQMTDSSAQASDETETLADAEEQAAESTGTFADRVDDLKTRVGEALGGLKELGGKVLNAVKTGLLAAGAAAVGAVTGLTALVLKSAASADELVELSDKTGLSVEQLQELQYIGEQTGTSMETVTGSLAKLVRSMAGAEEGTGAAADAFKQLGVPVTDANGELRDSQEVFGDVLDALKLIENPTERDALAMEIFGKSAQELNPLIDAGSQGMRDMAEDANNLGAVMDGEAVSGLAALNDMLAGVKLGLQGFLGTMATLFLPIFQTVFGFLQATVLPALETFGNYIANVAEHGVVFNSLLSQLPAPLQDIAAKVGTLVLALQQLFAGDFQGALSTLFPPEVVDQINALATGVQNFINQLVVFVTEHAEGIKAAFIAIGATLAAAGIVAALTSILNPITLIVAAIGLLAAAWAEDWGGIRTALEGWWNESGQQIFETLKTWLETNIPVALQTLSDFWTGTLQPAIQQVWDWIQGTLLPLLSDLWEWLKTNLPEALETLGDFWENTLQPAIENVWGWISGTLFPLLEDLWAWLEETIPEALETLAGFWEETLQPALETVWGFIQDDLMPLFEDLQALFEGALSLAITAITGLWDTLYDSLYDVWDQVKTYLKPALDLLEAFFGGLFKQTLSDTTFLDTLTTAFDTLAGAIKAVRDFIQTVILKLQQMGKSLPEWAVPGSPMPLETAMWGLGDAMDDIAKNRLTALQRGFAALGEAPGNLPAQLSPGNGGAGSSGPTTIYQLQANYAYQSPRSLMAEVRLSELMRR